MADVTDLSPPSDWQTGFTSHWTYKQQLQVTHMADITDLSPPSDWQTGFTSYQTYEQQLQITQLF